MIELPRDIKNMEEGVLYIQQNIITDDNLYHFKKVDGIIYKAYIIYTWFVFAKSEYTGYILLGSSQEAMKKIFPELLMERLL